MKGSKYSYENLSSDNTSNQVTGKSGIVLVSTFLQCFSFVIQFNRLATFQSNPEICPRSVLDVKSGIKRREVLASQQPTSQQRPHRNWRIFLHACCHRCVNARNGWLHRWAINIYQWRPYKEKLTWKKQTCSTKQWSSWVSQNMLQSRAVNQHPLPETVYAIASSCAALSWSVVASDKLLVRSKKTTSHSSAVEPT